MKLRDRIRELRRVPASELRPNPKNWRTHPKAQADALRGVLAEIGIADAVLARELPDGSLMLLDGHLRLETMADQILPVLVLDVDEAEGDKVLATLDPLAAMAEADSAKLDAILRDVDTGSPELQQMLSDLAEDAGLYQDEPEIIEDEVPEPPADPITKPGDLWVLGEHRLLCGDSTKAGDVERLMAGAKADMVFTDPPYGVDYDGGHAVKGKRREKLANDATPDIYVTILPVVCQFSKDTAALYLWFSDSKSAAVTAAVTAAGYEVRNTIIWNKNLAQFGAIGAQYKSKHEPCLYCFKKGNAPYWQGPNNEVSVWDVARSSKNEFHPTQKPVGLPARAFGNSCPSTGLVLDVFLGSGTTLIAAEQLGRKCYGMEISPQYCDVIVNRWETLTGKKAELETQAKKPKAK